MSKINRLRPKSILKVVRIHQHARFQAITVMCSPKNIWKLQIRPVSQSQIGIKNNKISDRDHNLISSESGQDAHRHAKFHAIPSMLYQENARKSQIWPIPLSQIGTKRRKIKHAVTIIWSVLKVVRIHWHAQFQAIPSMRSPGNARNTQLWNVSLNQIEPKLRISTAHDHNLLWSERGWDTSTFQISGLSFSGKCLVPQISPVSKYRQNKET